MRRIRLRDFFAGKKKPPDKPPLDTEGLLERALDEEEPDIEGFAREAVKERRKLWHTFEDSVDQGKTQKRD